MCSAFYPAVAVAGNRIVNAFTCLKMFNVSYRPLVPVSSAHVTMLPLPAYQPHGL